jgi:hypothetical protein
MSQVQILPPRPLISLEFFYQNHQRFQLFAAHGSRNGSSFGVEKSLDNSAVLGRLQTAQPAKGGASPV